MVDFPKICTKNKGVSLIELILVVFIMTLLLSVTMFLLKPWEQNARARDNKRLSDLSVLERVINEYYLDNGEYPDNAGQLRSSNTLPSSNSGPLQSAVSGWIFGNFTKYNSYLPTDPLNDSTYNYRYIHSDNGYELDVLVEYETQKASDDGGNSAVRYEVGSDLSLL